MHRYAYMYHRTYEPFAAREANEKPMNYKRKYIKWEERKKEKNDEKKTQRFISKINVCES